MIFKICIIILISIAILNAQTRFVSVIFPNTKEKKKIFQYTLLMGFLVASLLLGFSHFLQPRLATQWHNIHIAYAIFITIAGWLLSLFLARKKQRRATFIISTATIIALLTWWIEWLLAGTGIWFLFLKAAGEEVLKTSTSQALTSHGWVFKSDVIIMSIIAGLWFALFENIVYFIESGSRWQFLIRTITTSLLHAIFTGSIGYVLRRHTTNSYLAYIYAYTLGISLHIIYNLSMTYIPRAWWVVFVIGGYFLMTYLLYKSDRLYIE